MQREYINWVYRAWRYRLVVERQEVRVLRDCLHPGDTAIDIGAHKGAYTYWMRSRVGATGGVVAFEPQKELAERLKRLIEERGLYNVTVENLGLSSATGRRDFFAPEQGSSPGASFEPSVSGNPTTIPLEAVALDDYLAGQYLERVRFIKCDVEGHELEVFEGARQLLASERPALLFECEIRHRASASVDEVFEYLGSLGYRGFALSRKGPLALEDFTPAVHQRDPDQRDYINNFFFRHPDGHGDG